MSPARVPRLRSCAWPPRRMVRVQRAAVPMSCARVPVALELVRRALERVPRSNTRGRCVRDPRTDADGVGPGAAAPRPPDQRSWPAAAARGPLDTRRRPGDFMTCAADERSRHGVSDRESVAEVLGAAKPGCTTRGHGRRSAAHARAARCNGGRPCDGGARFRTSGAWDDREGATSCVTGAVSRMPGEMSRGACPTHRASRCEARAVFSRPPNRTQ